MRAVRALAAAIAFLTRLPVGRLVELDAGDVARGAPAFPIVGAGIGAAMAGIAVGLSHILPALAAAGLGIAGGVLLTGALHLDALADTADALTKKGDRALAIMRDHATGAYGATAIALDLIVKTAVLAALVVHGKAVGSAVAAGALSRAVPLVVAAALPPVRADGAGASVGAGVSRGGTLAAVIVAVAVAVAAGPEHGLELAAVAAAIAGTAIFLYRQWLGGVTGDLLGAATEVTETVLLATAAALTGSR
jgi:adenosylcobinamide-GDP ribazoletransferase